MSGSLTRHIHYLCLCAALVAQGACTDLPTGTDSFQLQADGQIWAAVVPPADLPDANSWLGAPGAPGSSAEAVRQEVVGLQEQAARATARGDLERAKVLRGEAARRAISALEISPRHDVFIRGLASLEAWQRSVGAGTGLGDIPALADAVDAVRGGSDAVRAALQEGDVRTAALRLTEAAERIREWSPEGVALKVLERVDLRLADARGSSAERERAAHLVQSARYELVAGNPLLATQRALYALQLAAGRGLGDAPTEERARCGEYGC